MNELKWNHCNRGELILVSSTIVERTGYQQLDYEMDFTCSLSFGHHTSYIIYIGKSCQCLFPDKILNSIECSKQRGQKSSMWQKCPAIREWLVRLATPLPADPFLIVHHATECQAAVAKFTLSLTTYPSAPPPAIHSNAKGEAAGHSLKGKNSMCDSYPTPNYPFIPPKSDTFCLWESA